MQIVIKSPPNQWQDMLRSVNVSVLLSKQNAIFSANFYGDP